MKSPQQQEAEAFNKTVSKKQAALRTCWLFPKQELIQKKMSQFREKNDFSILKFRLLFNP